MFDQVTSVVGDFNTADARTAPQEPMKYSLTQVCPSINRNCGVGNFARNFADAVAAAGVKVETLEQFPAEHQGDLLIQHEFGLFNTEQLRIDIAQHRGRVFILAHSRGADSAFTDNVAAFITLCDGMTAASAVSHVLPHPGWQQLPLLSREDLKRELGWTGYRCVIGTNGFISPTRAFDEVVAKLGDFAIRENVLVHVVCPPHHNHDDRNGYGGQEKRLRDLEARYPRNVQLEMRFLDQAALSRRLQAMDIAWCWTKTASLPYGSGTCSDQYGSGTRLVVADKRQHRHVIGLPNVVSAPADLSEFVEALKAECLRASFPRHDPSPVSWGAFAERFTTILRSTPSGKSKTSPIAPQAVKKPIESTSGQLSVANADVEARRFLTQLRDCPNDLTGRGIVICAGGVQYFACAWVAIRMLRTLGCLLPIEVWCYEDEMDPGWRDLVRPFGATLKTTTDSATYPHARWRGWRLKPTALLNSAFREVLLLDADIVPTRDPAFLFESREYAENGALFWPDKLRTPRKSEIWRVFGVNYRDEPDQESGQLIVDKHRCWQALNLCRWYNDNASFFYRFVYGDKDTFRLAWRRTNTSFAMPSKGVVARGRYLLQYDFAGEPLFQHRVHAKWTLEHALRLPGFIHEEACLAFLKELRERWTPVPRPVASSCEADTQLSEDISKRKWKLSLIGSASWVISLTQDGVVSSGATRDVSTWWVRDGKLILATNQREPRYLLASAPSNSWRGSSLKSHRLRAELVEVA